MSYQVFGDDEHSIYLLQPGDSTTLRWHGLPSNSQGLQAFAPRSGLRINAQPMLPCSTLCSGGNGVIYGVVRNGDRSPASGFDSTIRDGDLVQYQDTARDGSAGSLSEPTKIGVGWEGFRCVFSSGGGRLYAVNQLGQLLWYKNSGPNSWAGGTPIGWGWDVFEHLFCGGTSTTADGKVEAVIYAIDKAGDLYWYKHNDSDGGSAAWANGGNRIKLASGWQCVGVFARSGRIFRVNADGKLLCYPVANHLSPSVTLGAAIDTGAVGWNPAPSLMSIRTDRIDITPSLSQGAPNYNPYLGGFSCNETPRTLSTATPHAEPLYIRCVVIWDSRGPKVLVVADVLAFSRAMHQRIRGRVLALNRQWQSSDFILQATHTHNGPVLVEKLNPKVSYNVAPDDPAVVQYSTWLEDQIVWLVARSLAAPGTPCTLDYQVGTASFAYNRAQQPNVERDVPIITARSASGSPLAVLFSYACHPVAALSQTVPDGDFPGGACGHIETRLPGVFAMFVQGACGDHDPTPKGSWDARDAAATALGGMVVGALSASGRSLYGPITTRSSELTLPLELDPTPSSLAAIKQAITVRTTYPALGYRRHAEQMMERIDQNPSGFETSVPLPIQLWQLQGSPGLRWLSIGGELVSGYAAWARANYNGSSQIMVAGYANEVPCYIPTEAFRPNQPHTAYEGGWDEDIPTVGGGNMIWYYYLSHFKFGPGGVEDVVIAGLTSLLAGPQGPGS